MRGSMDKSCNEQAHCDPRKDAAMSPSLHASAVVIVGDELLFGESDNSNQRWMLETLQSRGRSAGAALCLPDEELFWRGDIILAEAGAFPACINDKEMTVRQPPIVIMMRSDRVLNLTFLIKCRLKT